MSIKRIVVVGPNMGDNMIRDLCDEHHEIYFFEPMPDAAKWLKEHNDHPTIHVIQAACGAENGAATMNVYNNGLSTSFGVCTTQAQAAYTGVDLELQGTIEVEVLNAYDYLIGLGIDEVETFMTDAQGMDLEILRTMEPWLASRKIRTIICEADHDQFRHYHGVPRNNVADFIKFMAQFPWYRFGEYDGRRCNPDLKWQLEHND
tara:strand:+ start:1208 stop:1819 length:612 start_codon:yes stop_codon:yes gene_type:complete